MRYLILRFVGLGISLLHLQAVPAAQQLQESDKVVSDNGSREITLTLPENILDLPKLESKRHVVWEPSGWGDMTYVHNAIVSYWKGRLFVAWHAAKRGEFSPYYVSRIASARIDDLDNWTKPIEYAIPGAEDFKKYMIGRFGLSADTAYTAASFPRTVHATRERLYVFDTALVYPTAEAQSEGTWPFSLKSSRWCGRVFYTNDPMARKWNEVSFSDLDALEKSGDFAIRNYVSNHHFIPLNDGGLMAVHMRGCPITTSTDILRGFSKANIDVSPLGGRWHEPGAYEGPDGVLHWVPRKTDHVWHSYSLDRGRTWSPVKEQNRFPDNPGNKEFGMFPNRWVWYVGNPLRSSSRTHLVLAISEDGWNFNETYLLRWEPWVIRYPHSEKGDTPGYEYPSACYHNGKLYVVYSHVRDFVELAVVDAGRLLNNQTANK